MDGEPSPFSREVSASTTHGVGSAGAGIQDKTGEMQLVRDVYLSESLRPLKKGTEYAELWFVSIINPFILFVIRGGGAHVAPK